MINSTHMPRSAVFLALFTIILWSFLAFLGSRLRHVPPFFLVGVALTFGGLVGVGKIRSWKVPWRTMLIGVGGIFGYHYLLFTAFQHAPVVEANLMNYLWPLLIVLLNPIYLPGNSLRPHHISGALMGLLGASLVITGGQLNLNIANLRGYLLAGSAAFVWASYSLLTKRVPVFSTAAVGGFCLLSGVLALSIYFSSAKGIPPLTLQDWLYLFVLGVGPMGLAFFTWDAALKRGDPRIIGALAYLTPLTSTALLVLLGGEAFSWVSIVAMLLIISGAFLGSWDLMRDLPIKSVFIHRKGIQE